MTEREAVEVARRTAEREGWPWVETVEATLRRAWFRRGARWEIFSHRLGAMVRVVIDDESGQVLDKEYRHIRR